MKFEYVIPNYKQDDMVASCIQGIRRHQPEAKITVVDDASPSKYVNTLDQISKGVGFNLKTNFWNQGFGSTCNTGIHGSDADIVILVNNDIEFTMDIEKELTALFEKDPDLGIVGTLLYYPNGKIQHGGHWFNGPQHDLCHYDGGKDPKQAEMAFKDRHNISVTGALMAIRKSMVDKIGGFKKEYHLAYEDNEFCFRAWHCGYKVYYTSKISAIHHEGMTRGRTPQEKQKLGLLQRELNTRDQYHKDISLYDFTEINRRIAKANGKKVKPRPRRVGFIRQGALGDCIMTTGVIKEYKRQNPDKDIYVATKCTEPYMYDKDITKIFNEPEKMMEQIDEVHCLDMAYENKPEEKAWETYADVVFGKGNYDKEKIKPKTNSIIEIRENVQANYLEKIQDKEKVVTLHMAQGFWTMKHLEQVKWENLIKDLKVQGYYVISVGRGNDYQSKNVDLNLHDKLSYNETYEMIRMSDLFIGIDGGISHLAMTTATPRIIIFSVADPYCFVHNWENTIVAIPNSVCKFCRNKTAGITGVVCQQGDDQCIKSISITEIKASVRKLEEVF